VRWHRGAGVTAPRSQVSRAASSPASSLGSAPGPCCPACLSCLHVLPACHPLPARHPLPFLSSRVPAQGSLYAQPQVLEVGRHRRVH